MPNINSENWFNKLPPEAKAKLTPEVRQKLQDAISKLQNNPGLFGMMGSLGELGKIVKKNGGIEGLKNLGSVVDVQSTTVTNVDTSKNLPTPSSPAEAETIYKAKPDYNRIQEQKNYATPTFNPDVKGDKTRLKLIVLGIILIGGYIFFRYGLNGQIPEELLEIFN